MHTSEFLAMPSTNNVKFSHSAVMVVRTASFIVGVIHWKTSLIHSYRGKQELWLLSPCPVLVVMIEVFF
jgi:hypothetical protein